MKRAAEFKIIKIIEIREIRAVQKLHARCTIKTTVQYKNLDKTAKSNYM